MAKQIFLHRLEKNEKKCEPMSDYQMQLVIDNQKLIYYLVAKFRSKFMSYEEAVAECSYIMCRVAKIFKPELNFKFTTIATVAWRRHLGRITDVYLAKKNGYRICKTWQSVWTDSGLRDEDFAADYSHEKLVENKEEVKIMNDIIKTLPDRTQKVLKLRMEGMTLEKIGKEINVTRERVRQIEGQGIQLLRRKHSIITRGNQ